MRTVIKGTKTIEEYKKLKAYLEHKATEHYEEHKKAYDNWREGGIEKVWIDSDGYICVQYESGNWWHYDEKGAWW